MITKEQAEEIAVGHLKHVVELGFVVVTHGVPKHYIVYGREFWAPDDVWGVIYRIGDEVVLDGPSNLVVICKTTGKILYKGKISSSG